MAVIFLFVDQNGCMHGVVYTLGMVNGKYAPCKMCLHLLPARGEFHKLAPFATSHLVLNLYSDTDRDPSDMAANGDKHMDAEWKRIQKKTFTRWCNEHLKVQSVHIEELTTDLSDGVRLILLIEVLSQKKVGRYSKKPRVHAQRMENAEVALNFITRKERIRLVNIGECTRPRPF